MTVNDEKIVRSAFWGVRTEENAIYCNSRGKGFMKTWKYLIGGNLV